MKPKDAGNIEDISTRYSSLLDGNAKKISCPYEIIFNITASVMNEDSEGNDIGCQEMMVKNYHIPVKEGADHNQFIEAFFGFLEKCLASSAKHAYEKETQIKEEQSNG